MPRKKQLSSRYATTCKPALAGGLFTSAHAYGDVAIIGQRIEPLRQVDGCFLTRRSRSNGTVKLMLIVAYC